MKLNSIKFDDAIKLLVSIIICLLAGVLGSFFTAPAIESWYSGLNKPVFNPPNWIFGPVWTVLYVLMGVSFFLVWENNFKVKNKACKLGVWLEKKLNTPLNRKIIISIFFIQLFLNIFWSVVFFGMQNIGLAFAVILLLWLAILSTASIFYRVSRISAYLFIPYLAWVSFAGILNFAIWIIN
jgi:tryptophan-rich sensory protein